ncbi:hypothetical protein O9992_14065 [Vibrio lentus]|nr:hypothetical protein [Vibrio lentus]
MFAQLSAGQASDDATEDKVRSEGFDASFIGKTSEYSGRSRESITGIQSASAVKQRIFRFSKNRL